MKLEKSSCDQ